MAGTLIANSSVVPVELPCTLEQFLISQNQSPRSVVVELNGEAVSPSDFTTCELATNDRLEIVCIVAGG